MTFFALVAQLFEADPHKRLGANGIQEIQRHPFFASIDWTRLKALDLEPSFKPDVRLGQCCFLPWKHSVFPIFIHSFLFEQSHTVHANSIGEVGELNKVYIPPMTRSSFLSLTRLFVF